MLPDPCEDGLQPAEVRRYGPPALFFPTLGKELFFWDAIYSGLSNYCSSPISVLLSHRGCEARFEFWKFGGLFLVVFLGFQLWVAGSVEFRLVGGNPLTNLMIKVCAGNSNYVPVLVEKNWLLTLQKLGGTKVHRGKMLCPTGKQLSVSKAFGPKKTKEQRIVLIGWWELYGGDYSGGRVVTICLSFSFAHIISNILSRCCVFMIEVFGVRRCCDCWISRAPQPRAPTTPTRGTPSCTRTTPRPSCCETSTTWARCCDSYWD